ncbi:acyltransferase family protein [Limnovirga soli]|uniref:Acyltransferase family protein n=1 Tax=Limnovirga soli TaxID=2656915 RepID=A0A8J8JYX0_9BACT|nr:acyltransferase [Limnovirga soli]NNV57741.1 acyltransferase family protein [Limnovirga soli]
MVSTFTSSKFKFWSFISMVLLVFVHGYNLQERYLQPWTLPHENVTFTSFTQYFLANGLFRFRIPMLFVISGYLFALHDYRPYKDTIKKRVKTILLPYLTWSAIGILMVYLAENNSYCKELIANSHLLQIDNTRLLLHDYTWYEVTARWLFAPVPYQLWFLRVLFIYNLAYPFLKRWVTNKRASYIFFSIAILLWLGTFGMVFFEGEGLLFFSLGIWLQKNSFNIETPGKWLSPKIWGLVFVLLSIIKTWLAFNGEMYVGNSIYFLLTILHKMVIVSGLVTAWFGGNTLVSWSMRHHWFIWLSSFSFIIYALHAPWVALAINPCLDLFKDYNTARMLSFIILPMAIIGVCIGIGYLLRKIFPNTYSFLTGGRGI